MIGRMRRVWKSLRKRLEEADAQDLVEYALLLMMVGLAVVASVKSVAATIKNAFTNANAVMVEASLPGNATGTIAASLANNVAALNAAANVNGAAATAAAQAAAAAHAAAVAANGGTNNINSAAAHASTAVQADLAAAAADNVVAADDALAAIDDGAAGIAAAFGINNGPIGSNALTAAANVATADAAHGVQAGTILGF